MCYAHNLQTFSTCCEVLLNHIQIFHDDSWWNLHYIQHLVISCDIWCHLKMGSPHHQVWALSSANAETKVFLQLGFRKCWYPAGATESLPRFKHSCIALQGSSWWKLWMIMMMMMTTTTMMWPGSQSPRRLWMKPWNRVKAWQPEIQYAKNTDCHLFVKDVRMCLHVSLHFHLMGWISCDCSPINQIQPGDNNGCIP